MAGIDTHVHSTASDGAFAPSQLIVEAQARGLLGMALTDHDSIGGLAEARKKAQELDFSFIPGIEISAEQNDHDVHILGYWLDEEKLLETGRLQQLAASRVKRIYEMTRRLRLLGMDLDPDAIIAQAGVSPGRPHIAQAMISAGYALNMKDAFGKWLSRGMPAYVPREKVSPFEAISLIRACDGVAAVAHPGCGVPDQLLAALVRAGIGGIEVYHPEHNAMAEQKYSRFALLNKLAALGGSDFHAPGIRELGSRITTVGQLGKLAMFRHD
jgi:predicted metal-dependent phosphoesterase TrpH